jgi:hypothetical protein
MLGFSSISKNSVNDNRLVSVKKPGPFFCPVIQPKLSINQPNDIYEQEADAMADKVMRMPDVSKNDILFFKPSVSTIQRKCAHCEEEEKKIHRKEDNCGIADSLYNPFVQNKPVIQSKFSTSQDILRMAAGEEEEKEESIQRKASDAYEINPKSEGQLTNVDQGQPLHESARSFFEPRFGQSFSDVRIHTGAAADQAAKSINAKAYTLGNNITFANGEYDFSSSSGRRLMAHELTHTLQQSAGTKSVQRGSAGLLGGKCCLRAPRVEWALVGAGVWKKLEQGECTGTWEDADGMTCGGGFYRVGNGQAGTCSTPRNDDATFAPRRWTPSAAGASATSPTAEGSTRGDTPPNYVYDSAATAACPNGVRTITVDSITLDGATQSPAAQLATANAVYRGCCVQFVAGATPPRESPATTQSWLGGDTDLAWDTSCGAINAEEKAMFDGATTNHGLSSRMRVFYVATMTPSSALANSLPAYCATGSASRYLDYVEIRNAALPDTLAHEFGHILLNSGNHAGIVNPADTRNLMFAPGRTASDLDATQCATIYGNA